MADEAVIGFLIEVNSQSISHEIPVKFNKSSGSLNLRWNGLSVKVLTKPYSEKATLVLK